GLTLAFTAVLLSGAGRVRTLRAASAGAVLLTLAGAVGQAGGVSPETKDARTRYSAVPQQVHECTGRDGVRYCAFPEWTARTGDWAAALESVTALAGDAAADRRLVVRQRVEARYGLTGDSSIPALTRPGEVTVGTSWGGNRVPEFTTAVAGVLVAGTEKDAAAFCDGRTVTVMWLALAGRPDPVADLRRVRLDDSDTGSALVISQTEPTYMTAAHTEVVRAMLDRPRSETAAKVRAHWDERGRRGRTRAGDGTADAVGRAGTGGTARGTGRGTPGRMAGIGARAGAPGRADRAVAGDRRGECGGPAARRVAPADAEPGRVVHRPGAQGGHRGVRRRPGVPPGRPGPAHHRRRARPAGRPARPAPRARRPGRRPVVDGRAAPRPAVGAAPGRRHDPGGGHRRRPRPGRGRLRGPVLVRRPAGAGRGRRADRGGRPRAAGVAGPLGPVR